jgi:hypothetical protein
MFIFVKNNTIWVSFNSIKKEGFVKAQELKKYSKNSYIYFSFNILNFILFFIFYFFSYTGEIFFYIYMGMIFLSSLIFMLRMFRNKLIWIEPKITIFRAPWLFGIDFLLIVFNVSLMILLCINLINSDIEYYFLCMSFLVFVFVCFFWRFVKSFSIKGMPKDIL